MESRMHEDALSTLSTPTIDTPDKMPGDAPGNRSGADQDNLSNQYAAIDLGSNSFHLIVARLDQCELQPIDRLGEKVQLAAGLDADHQLDEAAMARGMACLERFAQRIAGIPREQIRVVGTNSLRAAYNRMAFIEPAEALLGCPVEVISGREEARLIYLGVAHSQADDGDRRLVIDIGGGSTELIIGERFSPLELESLHMGCVSYTQRYFANGQLSPKNFKQATNTAHLELLSIRKQYLKLGWSDVLGSSGTLKALLELCQFDPTGPQQLSLLTLNKLKQRLIGFGSIDKIKFDGLKTERAQLLPGGLAILIAIFESLKLNTLSFSDGALREGLLYDMIGRRQHEDVRERTINALLQRFHIDMEQAGAVETTALACLAQTPFSADKYRYLVSWAARLHEVGLSISHSQFQKHGGYLIQHSDLMGFSQSEQLQLALLVRGHRRKLPLPEFGQFRPKRRQVLLALCMLLRLAVVLNQSRQPDQVPEVSLDYHDDHLTLSFPPGWLDDHPLTLTNLEREQDYLKAVGYALKFS
ncbi:MAG: exopolyphosphatase/guanosine-5'-triphosphate,3'-diphosphate pyrophosphatase [Motiliproteus sp.]|jgi:exopolyphosphatase/guanosine-5'-triphosphate,3'-diphosphate pyrophosphatase